MFVRHRGRNELERVAADVHVGDGLLDLRHMATHALISGRTGFVMRVSFDGGGVGPVGRRGTVTGQANRGRRLQ